MPSCIRHRHNIMRMRCKSFLDLFGWCLFCYNQKKDGSSEEVSMNINGVEMIPSGLVTCLLDAKEIGITELSPDAFRVRLAEVEGRPSSLMVCFFHFQESRYEEVEVRDWEILEERQEQYYTVWTLAVRDDNYRKNAMAVIRSYTEYVMLKMTGDDGYCSKELVGYPAEKDEEMAPDFDTQRKEWFGACTSSAWSTEMELALVIDEPKGYQQYLGDGIAAYARKKYEENALTQHPIAMQRIARVYLGNQFCHNLFPQIKDLLAMMDLARKEGLGITIATTYLREDKIAWANDLLCQLTSWCEKHQTKIELVINDWGMARMTAEKKQWIEPVLGVLLNKRRKDPRYAYKSGYSKYAGQLAQNSLQNAAYRQYLKQEFGIQRYEYESCGYEIEIPVPHQSIHFPYYQTNTSQYCTLYARCVNQDRGKQQLVEACPYFCEEAVFLYPKHLKMVGRYNSISGMDDVLLREEQAVKDCETKGFDRMVLTLL